MIQAGGAAAAVSLSCQRALQRAQAHTDSESRSHPGGSSPARRPTSDTAAPQGQT
jgi:hypothetical protein